VRGYILLFFHCQPHSPTAVSRAHTQSKHLPHPSAAEGLPHAVCSFSLVLHTHTKSMSKQQKTHSNVCVCVCVHAWLFCCACVRCYVQIVFHAWHEAASVWSSVCTFVCHCLTCCYAFTHTCGRRFWCYAAGGWSAPWAPLRLHEPSCSVFQFHPADEGEIDPIRDTDRQADSSVHWGQRKSSVSVTLLSHIRHGINDKLL